MEYMGLINLIAKRNDPDWDFVHYAVDEAMEKLKAYDPSYYSCVMEKLGEVAYKIAPEKAKEIVREMRTYGEKWSFDAVKDFVRNKGISDKLCEWYMTMNMAYNDYHNTASMAGMAEDSEFYYSIARDFIQDEDGKKYKVAKYFMS